MCHHVGSDIARSKFLLIAGLLDYKSGKATPTQVMSSRAYTLKLLTMPGFEPEIAGLGAEASYPLGQCCRLLIGGRTEIIQIPWAYLPRCPWTVYEFNRDR